MKVFYHICDRFASELSVSSAGSKGVKDLVDEARAVRALTFSILGRIEGGERARAFHSGREPCTFSILGRIEGGESVKEQVANAPNHLFQYPRPDRRG